MAPRGEVPIPFPLSTFPGSTPQESAGRLINCHAEPLGPGGPSKAAYHRSPGLSQFAATAQSGYRGGLLVNNLAYEVWANNASTVNSAGVVNSLGTLPGTKKISIARNQDGAGADVVAVDIDNGAFVLQTQALANASATATIGGTSFNSGDTVAISFDNGGIANLQVTVSYTLGTGESATTVAAALVTRINENPTLIAAGVSAAAVGAVITIQQPGSNANSTTLAASVTAAGTGGHETVVLSPSNVLANNTTATIGGTTFNSADTVAINFANSAIGLNTTATYTLGSGETAVTVAAGLANKINQNAALSAANISATASNGTITFGLLGTKFSDIPIGSQTVMSAIVNAAAVSEVVWFNPAAGTSATAVIGGTTFNSGDAVSLTFQSTHAGFPVTVSHTLGASESATTIATALAAAINGNGTLTGAGVSATSTGAAITVALGPVTMITDTVTGTGNETVSFTAPSGTLAGGTGTAGLSFIGAPIALSTIGTAGLPAPKAVCFQDGYFFFLSANNEMFASNINALTFNALTFTVMTSKADVTGQRVIAFSGLLFAFTTGNCEVWQDTAQPFPNFPYSRLVVLPYGLLQENAIAGWETGFDTLLWVGQDFGVYMLPYGSLSPTKVSPPDLDRLIKAENAAGNLLEAFSYVFAGKRFWALSSPDWTWEFNLGSQQWNERQSLNLAANGQQGRWRAVGGHPAFGKWLCGDTQSGTLGFVDDTVLTEFGAPQLRRIESAPVADFPNRLRVSRADFQFSTGAGLATAASINVVNPSVAVSWSDDNGITWKNPIIRSLGLQGKSLRTRISVKNTGFSGPQARRWRLDDTDCAAPFMSATQDDDPKEK